MRPSCLTSPEISESPPPPDPQEVMEHLVTWEWTSHRHFQEGEVLFHQSKEGMEQGATWKYFLQNRILALWGRIQETPSFTPSTLSSIQVALLESYLMSIKASSLLQTETPHRHTHSLWVWTLSRGCQWYTVSFFMDWLRNAFSHCSATGHICNSHSCLSLFPVVMSATSILFLCSAPTSMPGLLEHGILWWQNFWKRLKSSWLWFSNFSFCFKGWPKLLYNMSAEGKF